MKFRNGNYRLLKILSLCSCMVVFAVFVYLCIKLLPGAVSYTVSTAKSATAVSEETDSSKNSIFDSIYLIDESGPFLITCEGEEIFVFSGEKRLYKVKAHLGQFPSSDKSAVLSGITVDDKASLYEIIQYMES